MTEDKKETVLCSIDLVVVDGPGVVRAEVFSELPGFASVSKQRIK